MNSYLIFTPITGHSFIHASISSASGNPDRPDLVAEARAARDELTVTLHLPRHAIELGLKAFLVSRGVAPRPFGHNLLKLYEAATEPHRDDLQMKQ